MIGRLKAGGGCSLSWTLFATSIKTLDWIGLDGWMRASPGPAYDADTGSRLLHRR